MQSLNKSCGRRVVRHAWLALASVMLLGACGHEAASIQQAVLPPLKTITVATASSQGRAADAIGWDGVIQAVRQADLTAQTSGRVTQVLADINTRVPAGAVLLRLSGVEQQAGSNSARARLRATEAAAVEADMHYRRYVTLSEGQYISKAQLDTARASRDAAVAARDAARAQLVQAAQQSDYTVVRAPFDGVIARRHVEPGEAVSPGQPLMSVYVPGDLRIEVQVPQTQADAIRAVDRASITLEGGREVQARRVIVFPTADVATHSVGVRLELPAMANAPAPGTTARVTFPITMQAAATHSDIRIPASAVVQRGELSGVYVIDGGRVLLRQLRLGRRDGDSVAVIAGLKVGERIAIDPVAASQALQQQRAATSAAHE